jgi:hypothetical protein
MLLVIALGISVFRYYAYPLGDLPDLCATIPDHLSLALQLEIGRLSCSALEIAPSDLVRLTLTGGVYANTFELPSFFLYIYSCLPFLFCSIGVQSLLSFSSRPRPIYHSTFQKLGLLIVAAPSTSYALISPKNEAFINCLGIIFFFAIVKLFISIDTRDAIRQEYIKHIPNFLLMLTALYGLSVYFKDNQAEIVLAFLALPIFVLILKYFKIQPLSFLRFSPTSLTVGSLVTYICLFLIMGLVAYSSAYLSSIYTVFANSAPDSIAFVASSGLLNEDTAMKYPTLIRPVFTLLTLSFGTASGYSIQIFSRAALILAIVAPFWKFLAHRRGLLDHQLVIMSLLGVLMALSVFPGYSNYKYWIFMAPLFFLPSALYSWKLPLILFLIVYAELLLKAVLLQFS